MQLLWVDKNFQNKDKINNYQLDNSRTTDSISNINKREELVKRKDKETKEISPKKITIVGRTPPCLSAVESCNMQMYVTAIKLFLFNTI